MNFITQIDIKILDFIYANIRNSFLDIIMPAISFLDNFGIIWLVTALLFFISKKHRNLGITLFAGLFMGFLVCNVFLKPFVARIRPFNINTAVDIIIKRPTDYAFPSGHTTSSFIAATIIYCQNRKWGYASFILASLIAFSRLYLYVHYPTDIITGIILGLCLGALANFLRRHYLDRISLNV